MSVLDRFRALREARAEEAAVSAPTRARESRPDGTEPRVVTRNVSMRPGAPDSVAAPVATPKQAPAGRFPRVTGTADVVLAATIIGLVFFGVVMVYSASGSLATSLFDDGYHYLIRQAIYAVVGLGIMVIVARVDYHRYQAAYVTYPILMAAFALLVVVALGGGRTVGGAARWIDLKVVRVQPAEIAKLAIIFYLSYSLSKKRDQLRDFKIGFLPHILVAGVFMLLCQMQPDFGSAVMIGVLTVVLLFTAGTRVNYILGAAAIGIPLAYALITNSEYRMRRIEAFVNPFADRAGVGYQIAESLISFAQGGMWGVGIGDSRQKHAFLPEAHTDFISAIVGEELGLLGVSVLLLAFVLLVYRGLRAAMNAADDYGTYLATGVTLFVGLQAFTNLSVALGLLPTKGLTLPFVSYGGSSLLVNCAAVGLLLNVSRPRDVSAITAQADDEGAPRNQVKDKAPRRGETRRGDEHGRNPRARSTRQRARPASAARHVERAAERERSMSRKIIVAGGGTGGHLFPGIAVIEELRRRDSHVEVLFVGTERGIEARVIPARGERLETMEVTPLKGQNPIALLKSVARLPGALGRATTLVRDFAPDLVLGVGGYASGPLLLAASRLGVPTALLEQNAHVGLTNRLLAGRVGRAYVTFDETVERFGTERARLVGNPVRRDFVSAAQRAVTDPIGFEARATDILVLGGSQGARALNQTIPEALAKAGLRDAKVRVVHQTGAAMRDEVEARYRELGVDAEVKSFIDDMARAYANATLIIGRAGATTLAEICAVGRPSVLIPFPFAADDHQGKNAEALEAAGAAICIREEALTADGLAATVRQLLGDAALRRRMSDAARGRGRPDAAAAIVDDVCDWLGWDDVRGGGGSEPLEASETEPATDDAPPDAGEDTELAPKSLRGVRPYIPRVRDVRACLSAPSPALRRRVTVGDASWE
ncbi:MAG: putative lipid II flippase FtsW [Sandaracinaceae bacterium]|nr:putative lipid II flippase FtsW [Sandaracinaceae bacterium]